MPSTESEIRALLKRQSDAMRAKDIDRLMSLYSPDIVYFDVVPPLRFVGSAALRARFLEWFDGFKGAIDMDPQAAERARPTRPNLPPPIGERPLTAIAK